MGFLHQMQDHASKRSGSVLPEGHSREPLPWLTIQKQRQTSCCSKTWHCPRHLVSMRHSLKQNGQGLGRHIMFSCKIITSNNMHFAFKYASLHLKKSIIMTSLDLVMKRQRKRHENSFGKKRKYFRSSFLVLSIFIYGQRTISIAPTNK